MVRMTNAITGIKYIIIVKDTKTASKYCLKYFAHDWEIRIKISRLLTVKFESKHV
jgi:hypothetical protein